MSTARRATAMSVLLTAAIGIAAATGLAGCTTSAGSEPEDAFDEAPTTGVSASGTAPIVFAFVCTAGSSGRTETYTTYSAAWRDDRTDCRARRITGTVMSSQQRAAVEAAGGDATLEELAAGCAVRGTGPWAGEVRTAAGARVAVGLLEYCPGHPDGDRLRHALAAWRS